MADATAEEQDVPESKGSKLPVIIGVVLALAGAGGGFVVTQSGLLSSTQEPAHDIAEDGTQSDLPVPTTDLSRVGFVEVPQLTISLGPRATARHLRFRASLEVPQQYVNEVGDILPRVQDVLNSYLRALEPSDLEAPGALVRLRAQMLRRVKLVAGEGRVRDLLVLEFVLN